MLKPVGHKIPWPGKPPYHWQCRTTLIPWLKSFSELAGPSSKLPKDKIKLLESLNPGQRASLTYGEKGLGVGKRVSGEMTYNDWLLTQPESIQVDVLGPHRHKLWKEHKLGMEDLVHQNGRPLTIAELEKNLGLTMEEIEELASFELPMGKEGISPDAFEQYLKKDVGVSSDRLKAFVEKNLTEDMKKNPNYKDYRYFADNLVTDDEAGQIRQLIQSWAKTSGDDDQLAIFLQRAAKEEFGLIDSELKYLESTKAVERFAKLVEGSGLNEDRLMKGARVFLREMYNQTQASLKAAGIKKLRLYRGVHIAEEKLDKRLKKLADKMVGEEKKKLSLLMKKLEDYNKLKIETSELKSEIEKIEEKVHRLIGAIDKVKLQPMTSFSVDPYVAHDFITTGTGRIELPKYGGMYWCDVPIERIISTPRTGFGCLEESEVVVLGGIEDMITALSTVPGKRYELRYWYYDYNQWIDALHKALNKYLYLK